MKSPNDKSPKSLPIEQAQKHCPVGPVYCIYRYPRDISYNALGWDLLIAVGSAAIF